MATTLRAAEVELFPPKDSTDNDQINDVVGNKTDSAATKASEETSSMAYIKGILAMGFDLSGGAISNRTITDVSLVSPNGSGTNGYTWATAYKTLQAALTAASTDTNKCTLILVAINTGAEFYDIDTTSDPTFTGNYVIKGTHRTWQKIKNTHDSATSILKFTGYVSLIDLNFNLGEDDVNGIIITKSASRVNYCQFTGEDLTGAATAVHYDGATGLKHHKMQDCTFRGHKTYMIGVLIDKSCCSRYFDLQFHSCLKGIQIVDADDDGSSDSNSFTNLDIGGCAIGLDIDVGDTQHFETIKFHDNDLNIDDEVKNHLWNNLIGEFPITIEPITTPNYPGVTVTAGTDAYGSDTLIRAAVTSTKPFRIVGYRFEPSAEKKFMMRFSADSGTSWFDMALIEVKKEKAQGASIGTDFVFNAGTRISCSIGGEDGGSVQIWLNIQEI